MNWVPVILVCPVLACSGFVVWFCVLFGFVLCVFAVCLVYDDDGPMDYVQVLPQFSFAALNSRWPGTLICNYCSCNVIQCGKRPGESHEGVGTEKNNFKWVQAATDMHPTCHNKKQNHRQNCLLRRTQFWVRKTFSKPASLKRASLVTL